MEIPPKHRIFFRQSRSLFCKITICYPHFLHSAYLRQNCLAEGPSYPAESVHPKKQMANRNKATGGDLDIFADAELHLSSLG